MRKWYVFFASVFLTVMSASAGFIGDKDDRYYVTNRKDFTKEENFKNWKKFPYNSIVRAIIKRGYAESPCTSQCVGPDLILTAGHCAENEQMTFESYKSMWDGKFFTGKRLKREYSPGIDYAIYRIDPEYSEYFCTDWFDVAQESKIYTNEVQLAGFSGLRVLKDLTRVKEVITLMIKGENYKGELIGGKITWFNKFNGYTDLAIKINKKLQEQKDPSIDPLWNDEENLKAHNNCSITATNFNNGWGVWDHSNCDGSKGASGGALIVKDSDKYKIVGILSGFSYELGTGDASGFITKPEKFYKEVSNELKKSLASLQIGEQDKADKEVEDKKEPDPSSKKIAELEGNLTALQDEFKKLQTLSSEQKTEINALKTDTESKVSELSKLNQGLTDKQKELETKQGTTSAEVQTLKQRITALESEIKGKDTKIKELEESFNSNKKIASEDIKKQIDEIKNQVDDKTNLSDEEISKFNERINNLNAIMAEQQSNLAKLKDEIDLYKGTISEQQKRLNDYERGMEKYIQDMRNYLMTDECE